MTKKKILFFLESLSSGGAEKVLSDIVTHLDREKYDITVYTVTDGGVYEDTVKSVSKYKSFLHVEDYRKGGLNKLIYYIKMKILYTIPTSTIYKFLIHQKYDVEVAFIEGFATKFIASSSNKVSKKIAWVHTDMRLNQYADNYYKNQKKHCESYLKFSQIVCVSESVRESFEKKFDFFDNVSVQYNPIDDVNVLRLGKESIELRHPKEGLLLGTVGRLEQAKGYIRLLECINQLKNDGYLFELWIIGQGSQFKELQTYINEHELTDKVKLLGFQKNPYKFMDKCDAFICSSYAEGYSTAATESLILGKPIFTVDCAGMKELFGNYKCGEIVHNDDKNLYLLFKKLVSREIDLVDYQENINARKKQFCINQSIKEIEEIFG